MLFQPDLPPGFAYRDGVITAGEEAELAAEIKRIEFDTFEMRGVAARRRVAFYGSSYGLEDRAVSPMPAFLLPLRAKMAAWAEVDPAAFVMALINEYRPGTPIGWHRDAPQYDLVAGVSLLTACRMKLRPYLAPRSRAAASSRRIATHEIVLERRSGYVIKDEARQAFEHHIPAVRELRYSITFRTLRTADAAGQRNV